MSGLRVGSRQHGPSSMPRARSHCAVPAAMRLLNRGWMASPRVDHARRASYEPGPTIHRLGADGRADAALDRLHSGSFHSPRAIDNVRHAVASPSRPCIADGRLPRLTANQDSRFCPTAAGHTTSGCRRARVGSSADTFEDDADVSWAPPRGRSVAGAASIAFRTRSKA